MMTSKHKLLDNWLELVPMRREWRENYSNLARELLWRVLGIRTCTQVQRAHSQGEQRMRRPSLETVHCGLRKLTVSSE